MINRFIEWLNANDIKHETNGARTSVRAIFSNGYYIRASDFTEDGTCYIRDTGLCEYVSVFELAERVLYYKNKEKEN